MGFQNFKENGHGVPSLSGKFIIGGFQFRLWETLEHPNVFLGIGGVFRLWAEKGEGVLELGLWLAFST